ncbi:hypothetical protein L7F22_023380 [Adiantum nelumboides]|nr:hypothetical protein [Adiantum nelumboides]
MDHEEDYKASYAMALKATESVFVRKGLQIPIIANLDKGSNFFRLCISFPSWGERGCKMTTFRVSEIARAHITSQEKCRLLGLLASGNAALKEAAHHKKVKGKGKSSSTTINQPKDAHSPSIAKGRPPRTAKGRPSTSKKRPHPAVSESSESLEERFELRSREDAEDSRHADSEQESDSRRSSPLGRSRSQGSRRSSPSQQSRSQGSRQSSPARGSRSRDSRARTSDTARLHPPGPSRYSQVIMVTFVYGQMDPNTQLGGVQLMWANLPTHCKVDAGFGGVPLWNVFTDGIIQSVATLIVAMFVHDLDGPLPLPFFDRRARDIAADIDGYEADSDMLRELLRESSWTLDTSGAAFQPSVEKSEFFARWLITFTIVGDDVLNCLVGCGSMATECKRLHRHYISIEKDVVVF